MSVSLLLAGHAKWGNDYAPEMLHKIEHWATVEKFSSAAYQLLEADKAATTRARLLGVDTSGTALRKIFRIAYLVEISGDKSRPWLEALEEYEAKKRGEIAASEAAAEAADRELTKKGTPDVVA